MSWREARKALRGLTPEQQQVLQGKRIEAEHTPQEWLAVLGPLATYDRHADAARKGAGWVMGLSAVGLFASLFFPPAVPVPAVFFILGIARYRKLKRSDLANSLREFVLPLTAVLREEVEPGGRIHLRMDLGEATRAENQVRSQPVPGMGRWSVTDTYYEHRWLSGGAPLADGSRLEWDVVDHVRKRTKSGRNPRGKHKTKTKYRTRALVDVRVAVPGKVYALAQGAAQAESGEKVAVREKEKRNVIRMRRAFAGSPGVRGFLDTVASVYRRVRLAGEERSGS